ncbi:hypothetical protein BLNAU_13952 [Blattamonas nauphoetae]|uniref:Uncharacterized protein n=1 Tax=Blattamonas nauphoetae TaxID=2049346 RepID=A0ABQ9XHD3_9EUKA|nr:hypothetical protein BLNAU_13952 [Blattamonas nauphoetae]
MFIPHQDPPLNDLHDQTLLVIQPIPAHIRVTLVPTIPMSGHRQPSIKNGSMVCVNGGMELSNALCDEHAAADSGLFFTTESKKSDIKLTNGVGRRLESICCVRPNWSKTCDKLQSLVTTDTTRA